MCCVWRYEDCVLGLRRREFTAVKTVQPIQSFMATRYVSLPDNDGQTLIPVDAEAVAAFVSVYGVEADAVDGVFLVVESDGQSDVSLRNRTFDLVGPSGLYDSDARRFFGDRLASMVRGQAMVTGRERPTAESFGDPAQASRLRKVRFPGSHFQTYALVFPLRESSVVFGDAVTVYLYEGDAVRASDLVRAD